MNRVIGIAGPPGCGKSTLAEALTELIDDAVYIGMDQYQQFTSRPLEQVMQEWTESGGNYTVFEMPELSERLAEFKNENAEKEAIAIFETHFGRAHEATGSYIDDLVWIDLPLDLAFSRSIIRVIDDIQLNRESASLQDLQDGIDWLDGYVKNYHQHVHYLLLQQQEIRLAADLMLDGAQSPEVMTQKAIDYLKQHVDVASSILE